LASRSSFSFWKRVFFTAGLVVLLVDILLLAFLDS